jgi:hypothetical protein
MRFWTPRAQQMWAELGAALAAADPAGPCVLVMRLRAACDAALAANDAEAVCAALRHVDERAGEESAEFRFSLAIRAMVGGGFGCALAAWEDGGGCWRECADRPNVPSSAAAAAAMCAACTRIMELQDALDEHTLSGMLAGL